MKPSNQQFDFNNKKSNSLHELQESTCSGMVSELQDQAIYYKWNGTHNIVVIKNSVTS